jgi:hypothetical protein
MKIGLTFDSIVLHTAYLKICYLRIFKTSKQKFVRILNVVSNTDGQ